MPSFLGRKSDQRRYKAMIKKGSNNKQIQHMKRRLLSTELVLGNMEMAVTSSVLS
jgi:hypothetical protein